MRALSIFIFFLSFMASAQLDTIFYNRLMDTAVGEKLIITFKSRTTGRIDTNRLLTGRWIAYDSMGTPLMESTYKASRKKQTSLKEGLELFLDPKTGDTLLLRNYKNGNIVDQLGVKPAIIVIDNSVLHVYKDFSSYTVAEYQKVYKGRADFTTLWKSSIEDPKDILGDTAYLNLEQRTGDPSLLQPASFSTKATYNYVSNPEFEHHPQAYFSIMSFTSQLSNWYVASVSPDLYLSSVGALSGNSFVGIRVFSLRKDIEYLQNRLRAPLIKDSTYCFSAYLRLSPGSKYATNAFGFLLSKELQQINTDDVLTIRPSKHLNTQILNYKTRWMKVQCLYKAKGGERFLTLGSFQNHKELELIEVPGKVHESYYYIDDVSLVPIAQEEDCLCNFADNRKPARSVDTISININSTPFDTLKVGEKLILDNIHFANDESRLLAESYKTLFEVLTFMRNYEKAKVEISGHTSSVGGNRHNMVLSERRAQAVLKFLVNNGIDTERIETVGYGPNMPIADNETLEGQRENRRVEFKLLKK